MRHADLTGAPRGLDGRAPDAGPATRIIVHAKDPRLRALIVERLAGLGVVTVDGDGDDLYSVGAAIEAEATEVGITPRETEVLGLMAEGLANKEVAARLGITIHTAKFHVESLLRKLHAANRAEAVTAGIRRGLIMV